MTTTTNEASSTTLSPGSTVASIAATSPGAAAVFEQLGIDYCCAGKLPLGDACRKRNLDPMDVLGKVAAAVAVAPAETDWAARTMTAIADHIEATHHAYLKAELPRLRELTDKVLRAHGDRDPRLGALREEFDAFAAEMFEHMEKEERVLFPVLRQIERSEGPTPIGIDRPIACMMHEHDDAGRALERFRTLTDGYTPAATACTSWRVLLADLARMERDLHQHVHKENNILFPKALACQGQPGR